ncbi:FERM domain-containing protein 4A [Nematostella vectensis]|uniref:FERM domain-containing protein 4A n=1 Tax=Nematostella vectensis TaxID=45351 RepID=UPI0020779065|nr:FERM domain-containing protein 4A [Nematostella vectensis]
MNDARKPRKCQVFLLDERRLDFLIQPRLMSCDLLDMVASHFNLHEKEYFGLSYAEEGSGAQTWLRLDKRVLDHELPRHDPLILLFAVRFFVPNILILKEPVTVELFFLQARALIFKGSIQCDTETVFELAGYVLQAVYGDFTSVEATKQDLKKIAVLPTRTLKEHPSISYCEEKVLTRYKLCVGQTKGEAIVRYLCIFQSLPTYGVHYYEVKDKGSIPWWLGLSPRGIGVYDHTDKIKPRKLFQWNQIENIYFRDRKFSLEIRDSYRFEFVQSRNRTNSIGRKQQPSASSMMVHVWYASTSTLAKAMWSMAISQHQFYLDKKKVETKAAANRTLRDVARELSISTSSVQSSGTSDISDSISSEYSQSISTIDGAESSSSSRAAEREMAAALLARREALMEKLRQKTEELRDICIQEAEFIGEYPPETPYTVGSPLPPIRRRVGTSFEFSELVVDGHKHDELEEIKRAQMDVEIQSQITSAARKLAEDTSASKNVRKTRKVTYQKSLRKLRQVEEKLTKLKREYVVKSDPEEDEEADVDSNGYAKFNGEPYNPHPLVSPHYPRQYKPATSITLRKPSSTSDITHLGDFHERGFHSGPSSPAIGWLPRSKCPPSPSTRSYQGPSESHFQFSPSMHGSKSGYERPGPAFQYSDSDTRSDTRSDSSTKPSSVSSSYENSEDFTDNTSDTIRNYEGERSPPYRGMMISSWDNLNTHSCSRSPSPRLTPGVGQSSESIHSEGGDPRLPPYSPTGRMDRAFSFGSAMLRPPKLYSKRGNNKYLNTSDLAIVSSTGNAGSYSLNHKNNPNSRSGPNLNAKVYSSTSSLSTLGTHQAPMRGAASHMNMPYLIQSTLERTNQLSMPSFFEEDVLEWNSDEQHEATLV